MIRYDNPLDAALDIYNVSDRGTQARVAAVLRSGIKHSPAALRAVKLTYGEKMPVSAFLALLPTFGGRAVATLSLDETTPATRDGFYRRGSPDFHENSIALEKAASNHEAQGERMARAFIEQGVNIIQASDLFTLSSMVTTTFEGSLEDFADLYFQHGSAADGSHPAARQFALDVWADIATRYRVWAEAYMGAGR